MVKNIFATAGVALLLTAGAAEATPITTPPPTLTATGDVTAIYVFADAGDTSLLNEVSPQGINQIFCNHDVLGCTAGVAGQQVNLFPPQQFGPMVFSLVNTSTGNTTFFTDAVNATDGYYHALISTDYSVYGLGSLDPTVASEISTLQSAGQTVTFIGFEDAIYGDYDYNDLIFAFAGTTPNIVGVPEPITISLFGFGVAGAGLMTYRRRRAKKA